MDHTAFVHILEGFANPAGDFHGVRLGQWVHAAEQFTQSLAFEILHYQVRPALLLDRNELEYERVIEFQPDFLFAAKPVKSGRVALDLRKWNFDSHRRAGFAVSGLEQRSHADFGYYIRNLEPFVEHRAYSQF